MKSLLKSSEFYRNIYILLFISDYMELSTLSPTTKVDTEKAANLGRSLVEEVENFEPYVIENVLLLSPGIWNGRMFTSDGIRFGLENTNWEDKKNYDLIYSHDAKAENWVGYVKNRKLDDQGRLFGDLEIYDKDLAIKLGKAKAKMGISARVLGDVVPRGEIDEFKIRSFNNFSVVYEPACEEAWINLSKEDLSNTTTKEEKKSMVDEKINSTELSSSKIVELLENLTSKMEVLSGKVEKLEKEEPVEEVEEEVKEEEVKEEATEEVSEEAESEEEAEVEEAVEETEEPAEEEPKEEVKEEANELESKIAALEAKIAELSKVEDSPAPVVAELTRADLGDGISQLSAVEMRLLNELTRKSSLSF